MFCASQYEEYGRVSDSMLVNTVLMLVYVTKFFWWEAGYWNTMDIAHDRGLYVLLLIFQFYKYFSVVLFSHLGHSFVYLTMDDSAILGICMLSLQLAFIYVGDAWFGFHLFILLRECISSNIL